MARIELTDIGLIYPLRVNDSLTLKEFFLRKLRRERQQLIKEVRALNGVSLTIGNGERVGIIGRNGAGKTTLLRTIAGIFPIAAGVRCVEGSLSSLLDINVGFETDATGWENIRYRSFLQGDTPQILNSKIEDIARFTELGSFLDLPIRCYSAGMSTRLAFAIATSSQPEILLVDEVFGAGDLAFQRKAEERMAAFINRAQIVVMVGHNLGFLQEFCQRMIWLDRGAIKMDGPPREVIAAYRGEVGAKVIAA